MFDARFYRQHCSQEGQILVKDLRIFTDDYSLKDVIIVDNSASSFAYQMDNGVPIVPFYDDKHDDELWHLTYYLSCAQHVPDVRALNREAFGLHALANKRLYL